MGKRTTGLRWIAALLVSGLALGAHAAYPDRPITIIVPWGAGGAADALARALGGMMEADLKVPINVVNRTGGSGVVGHHAIAGAKNDGYTFGLATVEIVMFKHQGLAPFTHKDFTPIAIVNTDAGGLMVRADSPYQTARQLIDDIRSRPPNALKASGTGQGGIWHLGLVGWMLDEGIDPAKVPWVPSQGSAPAMQDLMAGGVDFVTASLPEGRTFIEAGRVRALANMDKLRLSQYANAPTLKEATGSGWTILTWRAFVGPKDLPREVVDRITPVLRRAHASKAFKDFMNERGFGWAWMEPDESMRFMEASYEDLGGVMRKSGLTK